MAGKKTLRDIAIYVTLGAVCLVLFWRPWQPNESSLGFKGADEEMRALLTRQTEASDMFAKPQPNPKENAAKMQTKPTENTAKLQTKSNENTEKSQPDDNNAAHNGDPVMHTEAKETAGTKAKINLNQATAKQLDALPGIGASRAQAIVALRQKLGGRFQSVAQLLDVKGIGDKMLEKIVPLVTLEP